jgi:hypothetical protein
MTPAHIELLVFALILVRAFYCLRRPEHPETTIQPVGEDFAKWLGRWRENNKGSN